MLMTSSNSTCFLLGAIWTCFYFISQNKNLLTISELVFIEKFLVKSLNRMKSQMSYWCIYRIGKWKVTSIFVSSRYLIWDKIWGWRERRCFARDQFLSTSWDIIDGASSSKEKPFFIAWSWKPVTISMNFRWRMWSTRWFLSVFSRRVSIGFSHFSIEYCFRTESSQTSFSRTKNGH